jgi:hypothetical protein
MRRLDRDGHHCSRRSALLGRYDNQYAPKLVDPSRKIHRVCFQHFHRMTPVTFIFQLYDPLVKCVKVVTQLLNRALDWKTSSWKLFCSRWLCTRCQQVASSSPLCRHSASDLRMPRQCHSILFSELAAGILTIGDAAHIGSRTMGGDSRWCGNVHVCAITIDARGADSVGLASVNQQIADPKRSLPSLVVKTVTAAKKQRAL